MPGRGLVGPHTATATELKARLEAERRGQPFLILRDGEQEQHILFLPEDRPTLAIGRDPGCDVRIPWDPEASRAHAELHRVGSGWTVADGGLSRNGTFLNGERLRDRRRL